MDTNKQRYEVRMDTYTRVCLTAIAVLMTVLIVGLWADHVPLAGKVQAAGAFVESGTQTQLVEMVKAQKLTAAKIDQLIAVLKSGQVTVKLVNSDGSAVKPEGAKNDAPDPPKKR